MTIKRFQFNGADRLMLAIDYQLRKCRCAGNNGVIALYLDRAVDMEVLKSRASDLVRNAPVICAPLKRQRLTGLPRWEAHQSPGRLPVITRLEGEGEADVVRAVRNALNRPLNPPAGDNLRFDLLSLPGNRQVIIMTWAHMLMDAHGAETLLALLGSADQVPWPSASESGRFAGCYSLRLRTETDKTTLKRYVNKSFAHIDACAQRLPQSLFSLRRAAVKPGFDYTLEVFTADETRRIRAGARRFGLFKESAYYTGAAMHALHRLYAAQGITPPSYVAIVTSDVRKKGTHLPLFSNQAASVMYQFLPRDCEDIESAMEAFAAQTKSFVRDDMFNASLALAEYTRYVPDWFYIKKMQQAFKGEFASAVIAYTGDPVSQLVSFLGSNIERLYHVPAVLTGPGFGIFFSAYARALCITLVHADGLLSADEVLSLRTCLRALLLRETNTA